MPMLVIWITGTLWAGKGTIVQHLVDKYNFQHLSVKEFLTEEIKKRKMPVNRDSMTIVANDIRKKFWPESITDSLYEKAKNSGKNTIIESVRAVWEVVSLRNKGFFYLFAVDADSRKRYDRIIVRWSETDNVSFSEFMMSEAREMSSNDPNNQNISRCMEMADYVFLNNWNQDDLKSQIDNVMDDLI